MTSPSVSIDTLRQALAGRYDINHVLGSGGMATVYRARDPKHARDVALKVLHTDMGGISARDRFLREIRLAANLTHPNILPLHDSGEADGMLYYVMPVMKGQTLRDRLVAEGQLPLADCAHIAADIADALDYAHRHGVIHRDVKPENILLHEGHAVLADFGIGKALEALAGNATQTQTGLTLGTPAYMSPEQAAGEELDGRSDLYALGCVMYEMLVGEAPFSGPSAAAVIAQRFIATPAVVATKRRDVPPSTSALLERLLARERDRRPATGAAVAIALRMPTPAQHPAVGRPEISDNSIAVLPFVDMRSETDGEYFADGLTEEIITDLARLKALRVTSRMSSMQQKGSVKPLRDIAQSLGVRWVLTGSVRRAGSQLRIAAQLVEAGEDRQLWAGKYSGTLDDIFDVQERVSREIVEALGITLSPEEDRQLSARGWKHAAAFDLALQARAEMWRMSSSSARWRDLLDRVEQLEGATPGVRALRLWAEVFQHKLGMTGRMSLHDIEREARTLVHSAPHVASGHGVLAYVAIEKGDMAEAIIRFREAIARDPSDSDARYWLMVAYAYAGMLPEAATAAADMMAIDPLSTNAWMAAVVVPFFTGAPKHSIAPLQRVLNVEPSNFGARWQLAYLHTVLGDLAQAQEHVDWMNSVAAGQPYVVQADALLRAVRGDANEALALMRDLDFTGYDAHLTFHFAEVFAAAGAIAQGMEVLADAVRKGFTPVPFILTYCDVIAPLRAHPGFVAIANEVTQRSEAVRRRVSA